MTNLSKEEKIEKLTALLNRGKNLIEHKSYQQKDWSLDPWSEKDPEIIQYTSVNTDSYPGWRMESLAILKSFLESNSIYVKEFEQNCKPESTESNLKHGLGILDAVKNGYSENIIVEETSSASQPVYPQEELNKQQIFRRLLNEFATKLAESMTFNQIGKLFFESGIIDNPEKPYGKYSGSKSDYVMEKLLASQNKDGFPEMLSSIQFNLCYASNGPLLSDKDLVRWMIILGYKQIVDAPDGDPSLVPPDKLVTVGRQKEVHKRIVIDNLASNINVLIEELNDNLDRNNPNASALLIRKILTLSCFISLDKIGKSSGLEEKELNEVLSITQEELKISSRVMSKVKSAKWIGDSANHSYKVKINESDVEVAATGLRIFLEEIF